MNKHAIAKPHFYTLYPRGVSDMLTKCVSKMCTKFFFLAFFTGCVLQLSPAKGDDEITLNEEYKGKTVLDKSIGGLMQPIAVGSALLELESAEQKLEVLVKAPGDLRRVAVAVFDADGAMVAASWQVIIGFPRPTKASVGSSTYVQLSPKIAKIAINELPGSGTYTICVYSNTSGDYSLLVKGGKTAVMTKDAVKKRDVATIQKDITATKQKLEQLEKELKTAAEKAKGK